MEERKPACLTCLVILLLTTFPLHAQTRNYETKLYTVEDGLSNNSVLGITLDSYGFLWIGCFHGVNRFDGQRFYQYLPGTDGFFYDSGTKKIICNHAGDLRIEGLKSFHFDYSENRFVEDIKKFGDTTGYQLRFLAGDGTTWIFGPHELIRLDSTRGALSPSEIIPVDPELGEIVELSEYPGGQLWVHTTNGFYGLKQVPGPARLQPCILNTAVGNYPAGIVSQVLPDHKGAWMIAGGRLFRTDRPVFSPAGHQDAFIIEGEWITLRDPVTDLEIIDPIIGIERGETGTLFFRTRKTVYGYSISENEIYRLLPEDFPSSDEGEGNTGRAIYYDQRGILWVGTNDGLLKILIPHSGFMTISTERPGANEFKISNPNGVLVDQNDNVWLGTQGNGLILYKKDNDGQYRRYVHYMPDANNPYSLNNRYVILIFEDSSANVYISSRNLQRADLSTGRVRFVDLPVPRSCSSAHVEPNGQLLLHFILKNPYVFDPRLNRSYPFFTDTTCQPLVSTWSVITPAGNRYLSANTGFFLLTGPLICSDNPVNSESLKQPGEPSRTGFDDNSHYFYPGEAIKLLDPSEYPADGRFEIIENGTSTDLFLLSFNKGFINQYRFSYNYAGQKHPVKTELVRTYSKENGLASSEIFELVKDDHNRIWCSTQDGLSCIDPRSGSVYNYYREDGLPSNNFYWGYHKHHDGSLWFCSGNGITWFHPDSVNPSSAPGVYLTGFRLFNREVIPGENSPLEKNIMFTEGVRLNHKNNYVSVEYTALDYAGTEKIRYRYKLEGIDREWVDAGRRRQADYPDLRPGQYTFRVIASNSNGVWNTEGASLDLVILPPFWLTWWFISLALILTVILVVILFRVRLHTLRLQTVALEKKVEEKTRQVVEQSLEMDNLRSRFYANVSHEFRTPLTLIRGPVNDLLKTGRKKLTVTAETLRMINRNAERLQRLINQLLDVSKLESGNMKLGVSEGNLVQFLKQVLQNFLSLAESRHIAYRYDLPEENHRCYFDADKVEKILCNLISNAFKFTAEGGKVSVKVRFPLNGDQLQADEVEVRVSDTGRGIPEEKLDRIFDRFYHVDSGMIYSEEGMGIGLALTRELVDLYRGSIDVESKLHKGSVFTIRLPVGRQKFHENEIVDSPSSPGTGWLFDAETVEGIGRPKENGNPGQVNALPGVPIVLVVEDNIDMRKYIMSSLNRYNILEANNGKEGFERAVEFIPDVIISDVMMPETDGIEMCRQIRSDERTSHIPVLLITARADHSSKVNGLKAGADDYIIKPFDAGDLQLKVNNLVKMQRRTTEKFKKRLAEPGGAAGEFAGEDPLLSKIMESIAEHYHDYNFRIEDIGRELCMSRSQLYRKIVAVTGTTPNELIRHYRVRKAAGLLTTGNYNVTQVMYEVGFRSTSHFAESFRKYMGVNPSEFSGGEGGGEM